MLTDALTFSSSEDFLLGLQGLEHVTVAGAQRRRQRTAAQCPAAAGWTLTVSTALTYDRDGHCVEGAGIPVDVPLRPSGAEVDAILERPSAQLRSSASTASTRR